MMSVCNVLFHVSEIESQISLFFPMGFVSSVQFVPFPIWTAFGALLYFVCRVNRREAIRFRSSFFLSFSCVLVFSSLKQSVCCASTDSLTDWLSGDGFRFVSARGMGRRWEWSPEARMMLGRLALWKGALLVSRTQAFVTGEGGLFCRMLGGRRRGMSALAHRSPVGGF